jgi:hypothetical protein
VLQQFQQQRNGPRPLRKLFGAAFQEEEKALHLDKSLLSNTHVLESAHLHHQRVNTIPPIPPALAHRLNKHRSKQINMDRYEEENLQYLKGSI